MKPSEKLNYVNNQEFHDQLVDYRNTGSKKAHKEITLANEEFHDNIAPIDIYINDNPNDAKYKSYLLDFETKVKDFEVVYGKEHFITWLRIDKYFHKRERKENVDEGI
jgi:hypothetical protein